MTDLVFFQRLVPRIDEGRVVPDFIVRQFVSSRLHIFILDDRRSLKMLSVLGNFGVFGWEKNYEMLPPGFTTAQWDALSECSALAKPPSFSHPLTNKFLKYHTPLTTNTGNCPLNFITWKFRTPCERFLSREMILTQK